MSKKRAWQLRAYIYVKIVLTYFVKQRPACKETEHIRQAILYTTQPHSSEGKPLVTRSIVARRLQSFVVPVT